jgi:hypothetical protein
MGNLGGEPLLPPEIENTLVKICIHLGRKSSVLRRRMTFSLAIRNNLLHDFSERAECVGRNELSLFLKINLHLALRKP